MRFDPTAFQRGRGKSRYPAFDATLGDPQDGQLTPENALSLPPYRGPAPMQEQRYPGGVKPGSETLALPMPSIPPAPQDPMAEFQKLGPPPRRQQVERGRQSRYAPFAQALSGLGDVFAAKAGQRGNYLDKNIALTEGLRDQDFRDRLMQSDRSYADDMAGYQHGMQGVQFGHQLGREGVADKAREGAFAFQKERAGVADKYSGANLDFRKSEADRAETDRAFYRNAATQSQRAGQQDLSTSAKLIGNAFQSGIYDTEQLDTVIKSVADGSGFPSLRGNDRVLMMEYLQRLKGSKAAPMEWTDYLGGVFDPSGLAPFGFMPQKPITPKGR